MMTTIKRDRVAERIQAILSELLLREAADPRLKNVTVTDVALDPELMFADVFVNALADESRQDAVMAGLARAQGFLRREIGKRMRLRTVPELRFHWDETLERGERINELLSSLDIPPEEAPPVEIVEHDED
jgi:ribosome-binding factor A